MIIVNKNIEEAVPVHLGGLTTTPNYYEILFFSIIIWHLTFLTCGLYESYRKRTLSQIILEMIKAVFIGMSVLMIGLYLLKITDVSRLLLVLFCLFNMVLLGISKSIIYRVLTTYRRRGFGSKQRAKDIIDLIRANSYSERFAQRQISVTEGIDPIFLSKHIFIMAAESATGRFIGL